LVDFIPPLSLLQEIDLDRVNFVEGGLIHSPFDPSHNLLSIRLDAASSVHSAKGQGATISYPSNKGFILALLEPNEHRGCD